MSHLISLNKLGTLRTLSIKLKIMVDLNPDFSHEEEYTMVVVRHM
jgi:hypothetical protein